MTARERAWLLRKRDEARDQINDAYWTFTRTARGKPPILVVPLAYRRVAMIDRMLARARAQGVATDDHLDVRVP